MKSLFVLATVLLAAAASGAATFNISNWSPLFKGVDYAYGNQAITGSPFDTNQQVNCLRIDLTDPDIEFLTTPRCTNCGIYETLSENTSLFLERNGLQVAVNCNFYATSSGPNDTPLGTPDSVLGLAISRGQIVSAADDGARAATLLLTTNNTPTFIARNWPAIASLDGIYTAVAGDVVLLTNGYVLGVTNLNDYDPRTAVGVSQDSRYLYLLTIDGRQPGWSGGGNFYQTGEWLARFGAWNGLNVDGGGSTTMTMADCQGRSVRLNRSSFVYQYGRERNIGHNIGLYARPLPSPLQELSVAPGATTAVITWKTDFDATTQVEFGLNTNYAGSTVPDPRPTRTHITTLTGLAPGSNYFFRALSTAGEQTYSADCRFSTTNAINRTFVFDLTNVWTYTTNNLDGVNWKARDYDDSGWIGSGPGLLYAENNPAVAPRNTLLPPGIVPVGSIIPRTYYFRTHFNFVGGTTGLSLAFSNYIDDGAVFHLNGAELHRLRMPAAPTVILNSTAASAQPCAGLSNAGEAATNCPDVFTISGNLVTNLVPGDNVLAVEVHNQGSGVDIVFGSALILTRPGVVVPQLNITLDGNLATLFWNGEGFALQQTADISDTNSWGNLTGGISSSPVTVTNTGTALYRLRQ
jgi:hypothetical protein